MAQAASSAPRRCSLRSSRPPKRHRLRNRLIGLNALSPHCPATSLLRVPLHSAPRSRRSLRPLIPWSGHLSGPQGQPAGPRPGQKPRSGASRLVYEGRRRSRSLGQCALSRRGSPSAGQQSLARTPNPARFRQYHNGRTFRRPGAHASVSGPESHRIRSTNHRCALRAFRRLRVRKAADAARSSREIRGKMTGKQRP